MAAATRTPASAEEAPPDLTRLLGTFLDRHLVFPLLEFLQEKEVTTPCPAPSRPHPSSES